MSAALSFLLAMILNPRVQAKAQAELDAVVGKDRLPLIGDKPDLPYIRSIVAEVLRWAPPLPLGLLWILSPKITLFKPFYNSGLPHSLTKDDVYEGYELPKGTTIVPNVWSVGSNYLINSQNWYVVRYMLHDPKVYSNPMDFNPDRFNGLDSEMKKVTELTFGFGRRFCPGTHFGESTLFSVVSTTLATCDVLPGLDKDGNEALPKCVYTSGTIVYVHFLHRYPILTSLFFFHSGFLSLSH